MRSIWLETVQEIVEFLTEIIRSSLKSRRISQKFPSFLKTGKLPFVSRVQREKKQGEEDENQRETRGKFEGENTLKTSQDHPRDEIYRSGRKFIKFQRQKDIQRPSLIMFWIHFLRFFACDIRIVFFPLFLSLPIFLLSMYLVSRENARERKKNFPVALLAALYSTLLQMDRARKKRAGEGGRGELFSRT